MYRCVTVACLALGLSSEGAYALDLNLRCDGVATVATTVTSTMPVRHSDSSTTYRRIETPSSRAVPEVIRLSLKDEAARIQLPRTLIPLINMGGQDGWWTLYDVSVTDEEISGRYRLNPLKKPLVRISRISGVVSVAGGGDYAFSGSCDVTDNAAETRKF